MLLVVAVLVVGPDRLPAYAEQLGQWTRTLLALVKQARRRLDEELGDDLGVDWAALDPRRYDPRRIVRDALRDEVPPARPPAHAAGVPSSTPGAARRTPFDDEAT